MTKGFVDLCQIEVRAGRGGDGLISFLRKKGSVYGRPDGGDGGQGGSVFIQADSNLTSLYDFTHRRIFIASDGGRGGSQTKKGARGDDLFLFVPVGTQVRLSEGDESEEILLADLNQEGMKVCVAQGGRGGKGNAHMSRQDIEFIEGQFIEWHGKQKGDRRFYFAEKGKDGEQKNLFLELKLIANLGFVGLPNAGKTTLLNRLVQSNYEVGDYPFTTKNPNLGVISLDQFGLSGKSLVAADIPGLISGASLGKGLGVQFLRHIERVEMIIHLIDPLSAVNTLMGTTDCSPKYWVRAVWQNYDLIRQELGSWSKSLLEKKEFVVINKLDITEVSDHFKDIQISFSEKGKDCLGISGVSGDGIKDLFQVVWRDYEDFLLKKNDDEEVSIPVYEINDLHRFN